MRLPLFVADGLRALLVKTIVQRRPPDVLIGGSENPYMKRWHVIPRNRFFNIYLHYFLRPDDDRALHDHPWWSVSLLLKGHYYDVTARDIEDPTGEKVHRKATAGDIMVRRPEDAHRVDLDPDEVAMGLYQTCWTLFITGPRIREWGFLCAQGWKHWKDFVNPKNPGDIGPGCGEQS